MRNVFTVRTAFLIVSLSIVSAFITGGIVLWFGMRYAENHQKLFTFISFIVGQGLMMVPLIIYLKYKNLPIFSSVRLKAIKYNTMIYVALFSLGLIILSDELDRIIQVFVPTPEYIIDLNYLLKPEGVFSGVLLFVMHLGAILRSF